MKHKVAGLLEHATDQWLARHGSSQVDREAGVLIQAHDPTHSTVYQGGQRTQRLRTPVDSNTPITPEQSQPQQIPANGRVVDTGTGCAYKLWQLGKHGVRLRLVQVMIDPLQLPLGVKLAPKGFPPLQGIRSPGMSP